ncbi:unnamed protein product, partial [Amoebophrya sp. A120]
RGGWQALEARAVGTERFATEPEPDEAGKNKQTTETPDLQPARKNSDDMSDMDIPPETECHDEPVSSSWSSRAAAASQLPDGPKPPPDAHYGFMGMAMTGAGLQNTASTSSSGSQLLREAVVLPQVASGASKAQQADDGGGTTHSPLEADGGRILTDFELHRLTAAKRHKRIFDENKGSNSVSGSKAPVRPPKQENFYNTSPLGDMQEAREGETAGGAASTTAGHQQTGHGAGTVEAHREHEEVAGAFNGSDGLVEALRREGRREAAAVLDLQRLGVRRPCLRLECCGARCA